MYFKALNQTASLYLNAGTWEIIARGRPAWRGRLGKNGCLIMKLTTKTSLTIIVILAFAVVVTNFLN